MKKSMKIVGLLLLLLLLVIAGFLWYLNRPLAQQPQPANFTCLDLSEGHFAVFDTIPENIYGVGLAYAGHINETAAEFDPKADPPIFKKAFHSLCVDGASVKIPNTSEILESLEQLEPGLSQKLTDFSEIPALMDYEVELGFVLLEDIPFQDLEKEDFIPKIGFYMANDLSARSLAVMGEGQENRIDYWGISKSFPNFLPISKNVWIPNEFQANVIPCVSIETFVNEELRQQANTNDLIYTPVNMLRAIHRKYPNTLLKKGDLVLTGTPGGVIFSAPRWLVRAAKLAGVDRFKKLEISTKEDGIAKFLKAGDKVKITGEGLGSVEILVSESTN